jgi:4'-phosphopantetheinyl transferase
LGNDEIHLWCTSLNHSNSLVNKLVCILSMDERARTGRYYFEKGRRQFIIRHGILRMILGRYLKAEPSELKFCYGRNGKPRLADTSGNRPVSFSMSSSEGLALYAFTRNREIGVDVECVRDIPEIDRVVNVIFSKREAQVYRALPKDLKRRAFFACWTRKEAFVKATGDGLSWPLDKFELTGDPGEPKRLLEIDGDWKKAGRWSIYDLKLASGFAAAVAAEGLNWELCFWEWTNCSSPQGGTEDIF